MIHPLPPQAIGNTDSSITLALRKPVEVELRDRFQRKRMTIFRELRFTAQTRSEAFAVARLAERGDAAGASLLGLSHMLRLDKKRTARLMPGLDPADESDCIAVGNYLIVEMVRAAGLSEQDIASTEHNSIEVSR